MEAPFSSPSEARSAYYGSDGTGGDDNGPGGDGEWHPAERVDTLDGGFILARQDHRTEDLTRWFVFRSNGDTLEFIESGGNLTEADDDAEWGDLPYFDTEQGARDAHAAWAEENPDDAENGDETSEWGEWRQARQIRDWWIYAREHTTEDRVQFLVAGETRDGDRIYLGPNGEVRDDQHVFESVEEIERALQAYYEAENSGDVPEGRQPTGNAPPAEDVNEDTDDASSGGGGKLGQIVKDNKLLVGAVGVGAAYLATQGDLDLPDPGDMNV